MIRVLATSHVERLDPMRRLHARIQKVLSEGSNFDKVFLLLLLLLQLKIRCCFPVD